MKENKTLLYVLGTVIVVSIAFGIWTNTKPKPTGTGNTDTPVSSTPSTSVTTSNPQKTGNTETKTTPVVQTETNPNVKTVLYKGTSFEPAIIGIDHGQEILFVNKSSSAMRLVFNAPGTSQSYSVYDQVKTVGKDETYQLLFNQPGIWNVYNLNGDKSVIGTVNVK